MGLPAHVLRPSGLTHGRPLFLFAESRRRGTHGSRSHQILTVIVSELVICDFCAV
jgi:hypothetical protein